MLAAIKKTLNSRLGTLQTMPLDIYSDINAYLAFFMFADYLNSQTNGTAYNLLTIPEKIIRPNMNIPYHTYLDYTRDIIVPPWIEEIADDAEIPATNILLPPSLKKIGDNAFLGGNSAYPISIPYSVKQIASNAFGSVSISCKIVINKNQNEIEGFPWGYQGNINNIEFAYE